MAALLALELKACALQRPNDGPGLDARQPCKHTLGNDGLAHRNAKGHRLIDRLIVREAIAVGGKSFEVQCERLFGVTDGRFISFAARVTAGQSREIRDVSVVVPFDRQGVRMAADFHTMQ